MFHGSFGALDLFIDNDGVQHWVVFYPNGENRFCVSLQEAIGYLKSIEEEWIKKAQEVYSLDEAEHRRLRPQQ
ncbi:hypothetical protein L1889_18245 [Paenalcaligenes niemegkensis]|uniref:hypothetical protein n=1 Tax=Paenalcaligenes niemegkensis TaxID=2895469 RepID=UPI001EE967C9|nr:hypothetical protein [Paenalcaligenes niemegkensis]MCQ9618381.1 hypothetical protein [Paenalcaligenes niemegkensis]